MSAIYEVLQRMREKGSVPALYWREKVFTYEELTAMIDNWTERLEKMGVTQGMVCAVIGDYSPQACSLFYALMKIKAIIVPFTREIEKEIPVFSKIAGVKCVIKLNGNDEFSFQTAATLETPMLIKTFLKKEHPGLVVFSSGSTGTPKGILQDCECVMKKFIVERRGWRTVLFLLMDHFGGFNTLLSTFAYGGIGICVDERTPEAVCRAIEQSRANLLPTTPTFLNFLLASGVARNFDLSSIELITYGTELMSEATLKKVREAFPNAKLKQTYGLSELGVLRSKSENDDSTWVKIGGSGFETKVIDGILWVRSEANMVGYLNAPNPIDADGWMCTGDQVEVKGDFIRFLGRKSEIINVGGKKVFPVEVENLLLEAGNICEASVYGVPHPILGQVVHARVSLEQPEDYTVLKERLRKFCLDKLAKYKVPMRFHVITKDEQRNQRFKKIRNVNESSEA